MGGYLSTASAVNEGEIFITVKPVLKDHCNERSPVLKDH